MATIVLQVEDESLVAKVKQACKMLMGVTSVKVQKTSQRVDDVTKTADYKAAMDDVKHGRVTEYDRSLASLYEVQNQDYQSVRQAVEALREARL